MEDAQSKGQPFVCDAILALDHIIESNKFVMRRDPTLTKRQFS